MHKILLIVSIVFCLSVQVSAQFTKGSVLLGGILSFNSSKVDNPGFSNGNQKSNNGYYSLSVGKAVRENAVFGLEVTYSPYSVNNFNYNGYTSLDYSNTTYSISIFYRAYKQLGKEFFLFGQASAGYIGMTMSGKDDSGNKPLTGSGNGGQASFMPGIAYKLSKKLFMELTIPAIFNLLYTSQNTIFQSEKTTTNQFSVSTSLSANPLNALGIGFRLVL